MSVEVNKPLNLVRTARTRVPIKMSRKIAITLLVLTISACFIELGDACLSLEQARQRFNQILSENPQLRQILLNEMNQNQNQGKTSTQTPDTSTTATTAAVETDSPQAQAVISTDLSNVDLISI